MKIYKIETVKLGADKPVKLYFDDFLKAVDYFDNHDRVTFPVRQYVSADDGRRKLEHTAYELMD